MQSSNDKHGERMRWMFAAVLAQVTADRDKRRAVRTAVGSITAQK